jgi:oxygen-independent coproporphyrinogen-3 oxidase
VEAGERPVAGEEVLGARDLALETVMLGLRTSGGVDLLAFRERFGADLLSENGDLVRRYVDEGIAEADVARLRLTRRGLAIADAVAREIRLPQAIGD